MQPLPPNSPPGSPSAGSAQPSDAAQAPWGVQQPPYGYPQAPAPAKSNTGRIVGIIVGVVMLVIVGVGALAAIAIAGTAKYLSAAKSAEAVVNVGQIGKNAAEAYTRSLTDTKLCRSARHPVPASATAAEGKKYQSDPSEWTDGDAETGWSCLKFEMYGPQHYQYDYKATRSSFESIAHGDLDGDGTTSTFTLTGSVSYGTVLLASKVDETLPKE